MSRAFIVTAMGDVSEIEVDQWRWIPVFVWGCVSAAALLLGAGVSRLMASRRAAARSAEPGRSCSQGRLRLTETVCWNVGRFWNGAGGIVIADVMTERFWSKH